MQPLNRITLHEHGDEDFRIGPNKRNRHIPGTKAIEAMLDEVCPLTVSCDVKQVQPPFFREFGYLDMLGGINLHTLSAEVTCRMAEKAAALPAECEFPMADALDKYDLTPPAKTYQKVAFLAGGNAMSTLDQSALQRLMSDETWMIKLHPVTEDGVIRDLASQFGYHRLIDPKVSGLALLKAAEEVAAMQTSELYLVARYWGKPVTDLTRYDRSWLNAYHHITRLLDGTDRDKDTLDRVLTSRLSGHLRVSYGRKRNETLARDYFEAAMEERERFRLITNQALSVSDKTIVDWQ